jgi:hypothetical protein
MAKPSWIGRKLSNRYQIEELLGRGGMSEVYKSTDPNLRRTVAVKLIHAHLSEDAQFVSRFEEEATAVAQLRHPNIIQVFDFANDDQTYYMVLEFIPGETLQDRLKRLNETGRHMPPEQAIRYTAQICDALAYAHQRSMIHRDIKPANIMLNPQGDAILMDFGIAKIVGGKQHTATGAVVGTAQYMSPEQVRGETPDLRVDIYSLGITLFEMLGGRPPFEADSAMTLLMMHVNDPVPDIRELNPEVPDGLAAVLKKALAKDRNDRFASATEFAKALRAIDLAKPAARPAPQATMIEEQPVAVPGATTIEPQMTPGGGATTIEPPPPSGPTPVSTSAGGGQPGYGVPPAAASPAPRRKLSTGALIGIIAGVLFLCIAGGAGGYYVYSQLSGGQAEETPTEVALVAVVEDTPTPTATEAPPTPTEGPPTETPTPTIAPTATVPPGPHVRINNIFVENNTYMVEYETFEYTEGLPGMHVHFFYDTVPPEQAGVPGSGPWIVWGGPRPFNGYTVASKPQYATQMCALVANANHSIILESGNCYDLPE